MKLAEGGLLALERAAEERLRLGVLATVHQQRRHVVDA